MYWFHGPVDFEAGGPRGLWNGAGASMKDSGMCISVGSFAKPNGGEVLCMVGCSSVGGISKLILDALAGCP